MMDILHGPKGTLETFSWVAPSKPQGHVLDKSAEELLSLPNMYPARIYEKI